MIDYRGILRESSFNLTSFQNVKRLKNIATVSLQPFQSPQVWLFAVWICICGAIWICGLSHLQLNCFSYLMWRQNTKQ